MPYACKADCPVNTKGIWFSYAYAVCTCTEWENEGLKDLARQKVNRKTRICKLNMQFWSKV